MSIFGMEVEKRERNIISGAAYYKIHSEHPDGTVCCNTEYRSGRFSSGGSCICPNEMKEYYKKSFSQADKYNTHGVVGFFDENGNFIGGAQKLEVDKYTKEFISKQLAAQLTVKPRITKIVKSIFGVGPMAFKGYVYFYSKNGDCLETLVDDVELNQDLNNIKKYFDFSECAEYKNDTLNPQINDQRSCSIQ